MNEGEYSKEEERAILERVNRTNPLVERVLARKEEIMKMSHEEAVELMQSTLNKIHDQVCEQREHDYEKLKSSVVRGFKQIEDGQFTSVSSEEEFLAMARERRSS